MKLIKCSDFVCDMEKSLENIIRYARFLKRPLELGMFIPCDEGGNVLEEQNHKNKHIKDHPMFKAQTIKIKEAKSRLLFEGFEVDNFNSTIGFSVGEKYLRYWKKDSFFENGSDVVSTIEDLTELGLTLTPNAIKQLM